MAKMEKRHEFLRGEFLTSSVLGAMQHSGTYLKGVDEGSRRAFGRALRKILSGLSEQYAKPVSEDVHLRNITYLSDALSKAFADILTNGRFRIGIAQKALNLYLKYLWCAGYIGPVPPHCPFDSIIIRKLPGCERITWTSIDSINEYSRLVSKAKRIADGRSLAEWELEIWEGARQYD